jgi:hypothetical protein
MNINERLIFGKRKFFELKNKEPKAVKMNSDTWLNLIEELEYYQERYNFAILGLEVIIDESLEDNQLKFANDEH